LSRSHSRCIANSETFDTAYHTLSGHKPQELANKADAGPFLPSPPDRLPTLRIACPKQQGTRNGDTQLGPTDSALTPRQLKGCEEHYYCRRDEAEMGVPIRLAESACKRQLANMRKQAG